ncbi:nucleotidyltransferase family protein [Vibrio mangrovi]|nr:nucleotidyltransferase family protein [Vibrio mangrovi]MDW6004211.1 nucleotidyltransferase family protein [Vibrio mangrovi]
MNTIIELMKQDPLRREALEYVSQLGLPQCYIAAGFVRNLVWDHLHHFETSTPLNDVDVIYFDPSENGVDTYQIYESKLSQQIHTLNWQVRNQALMHLRNGDEPYLSSVDAMSYWPEKETAVGIRQIGTNEYECISAFGFDSLFALKLTPNPKRSYSVFESRMKAKNWLEHWPVLKVES